MPHDFNIDDLRNLVRQDQHDEVKRLLSTMDPADVADLLEELEGEDEQDIVFDMLEPTHASETIAEMEADPLHDFVEGMSNDEIAVLISNMAPDDAADFVEELELSSDELHDLLEKIPEEERKELSALLRYQEDSGGSIMTPELCALPADTTVSDALTAIGTAELSDPIMSAFIVEPKTNVLLGYVYLSDLLAAQPDKKLESLINDNYIWAMTDEDQEKIAHDFRKYNLWVMPVVDEKHRLVGRITADDIMDVIQEEADEDMARMVGAPDFDDLEESPFKVARLRLPWLLITLVAGFANSILIDSMTAKTVATVAIFVPVLMAMGGNTSIQATAIAVRKIALGGSQPTRLMKTVWRQVLNGAVMGFMASIVAWGGASLVLHNFVSVQGGISANNLCFAIEFAMFIAMFFASAFVVIVPIILHRLDIDPAIASGPFVTTSNDLSASTIYFLICLLMLN